MRHAAALALVSLLAFAGTADARAKKRVTHAHHERASKKRVGKAAKRLVIKGPVRGQSVGAPWLGRLQEPARLPSGDGYVIRRPARSYGTKTTVEYIAR